MKVKPIKADLLVEFIENPGTLSSGLYIPPSAIPRQRKFTRAKVIRLGPDVQENIKPGDIVWVDGHKSGLHLDPFDVNNKQYIVAEKICIAIEENDS